MSGRIRSIKPEWLEDEKMAFASSDARVLSLGLILLADDHGRGRANDVLLSAHVFPRERDTKTLASALKELVKMRFVCLYTVDEQHYYQIRNWDKHQKVDHKGKPRVPPPIGDFENISRDTRETLAPDLDLDLRPHTTTTINIKTLAPSSSLHSASTPESAESADRVILIPLLNGKEHPVSQADISAWSASFPAVDIVQQLREIREWNLSHPRNRKTSRGIRAHITGWLSKEQNKARVAPRVPQPRLFVSKQESAMINSLAVAEAYNAEIEKREREWKSPAVVCGDGSGVIHALPKHVDAVVDGDILVASHAQFSRGGG